MKPHEKSVAKHQGRMEELMRYSTHLEGSRLETDAEANLKRIHRRYDDLYESRSKNIGFNIKKQLIQ